MRSRSGWLIVWIIVRIMIYDCIMTAAYYASHPHRRRHGHAVAGGGRGLFECRSFMATMSTWILIRNSPNNNRVCHPRIRGFIRIQIVFELSVFTQKSGHRKFCI